VLGGHGGIVWFGGAVTLGGGCEGGRCEIIRGTDFRGRLLEPYLGLTLCGLTVAAVVGGQEVVGGLEVAGVGGEGVVGVALLVPESCCCAISERHC
jgi:hypothetical protein